MQKSLNIPTTDKKTIFGTIDTPKGKSKGLIIFVHGLTDNFNSHFLPNSAKYFTEKGYTTYRFNLYGEKKQERKLKEVCFKDHITDIHTVIKYFQKTNQIIFLVGHSFGGLTIIYSNTKNINGIILRDASIGGNKLLDDVSYNKKTHTYEINRGDGVIHTIGTTMYKDFLVSPQKHLTRISKIHVPIKIICAERSLNIGDKYNRDAYYKSANEPKDLIIIPGSGHHFKEKGAEKKLFTETYKRIKEYS